MKRKISAYTITELLVVLLISMLVITCMLQLLSYTGNRTMSLLKKQEGERELIHTLSYLQQNFRDADNIKYDENRLAFIYANKPTRYLLFEPQPLIEHHLLRDTLSIQLAAMDTVCFSNGSLYLMLVRFSIKQKQYTTTLYKPYKRDQMINQVLRYEYFIEQTTETER